MNPNLGIDDKDRAGVVKILNALLADEYVLYTKTRNYHWNVVGPQFNDLHKFFSDQYEAIDDFVDDVAARARTLGAFGGDAQRVRRSDAAQGASWPVPEPQ